MIIEKCYGILTQVNVVGHYGIIRGNGRKLIDKINFASYKTSLTMPDVNN